MGELAIALCRVSTPEQRLNNSLNRQEESVLKAATELDVEIDRWWSGDISSKAGTNVKRKDLKEMLEYCKRNKKVKYLIIDEPDRFMRSIDEAFYFEVEFRLLGVTVWYASDPNLNNGDLMSKMLKFSKLLPAEGSNIERQTKSISGHEKAIREGRYTFPPKPAYMKGDKAGIHVKHPITHKPLKKAFKEVASGLYTPLEALNRLNSTEFAQVHSTWRMDKFRKFAIDPYYAGILVKDRQVKARNEHGLHEPMISIAEHEVLVRIFNGSFKARGHKVQYNPDFPMNKLMVCSDCGDNVKFTGSIKNNGYNRKRTTYYYKYECRGCHKSYHRADVHDAITKRLSEIKYLGNQHKDFVDALETVWRQKQQAKLQEVKTLQKRLEQLENDKSSLIRTLSTANDEIRPDIEVEIGKVKHQISSTHDKINLLSDIDQDLIQFLDFALNYCDKLADDWWVLDHETRVQCQQLIFPSGISFNSDKKVGTNQISSLYTLKPNKKDLSSAEKSLLVELVGTAPTSASLSWLGFYRHRLLENLRDTTGK